MATGYDNLFETIKSAIADTKDINLKKIEISNSMKDCYVQLIFVCGSLIVLQDDCFTLEYRAKNSEFGKSSKYQSFLHLMTKIKICERIARGNKSEFIAFAEDFMIKLDEGFDSTENFKLFEDKIRYFIKLRLDRNSKEAKAGVVLARDIEMFKKMIAQGTT